MNEYINLEAEAEHIEGDGGLKDLDNFDEISNLCYGSEEDLETDNFKNSEVDIKKNWRHFISKGWQRQSESSHSNF